MWVCPKCQHQFYNKNQSHSCGHYTLDDFLKNQSTHSVDLFHHFINEYKKIGPFALHPVKTRIALLTKMRFCAINKIGGDYLRIHFVLTEPYPDNLCFYKIENLANRFFLHHLHLQEKSDINQEVKKYMRLAYDVGNRMHINKK